MTERRPDANELLRTEGVEGVLRTFDEAQRISRKPSDPIYEAVTVDLVTMSDVDPQPIEWIWPGRIARRKLTLTTGEPDLGKSQIGLDVIARITTGELWPDDGSTLLGSARAPVGSAIILSAEDAIDDTIRPRLEAAGAKLDRIHTVRSVRRNDGNGGVRKRMFSLQTDLDVLGQGIENLQDVSLVMIDPITAYLGDQIDTHKTAAVRNVLATVDAFAHRYNVAVLGISHPPKAVSGNKAIHAVTGSLAFVAAARLGLLAIKDPNGDRTLLLPVKNNIGAKAAGLAYRLAQRLITNDIVASYVVWDAGPVTTTANEALAAAAEGAKNSEDKCENARSYLVSR